MDIPSDAVPLAQEDAIWAQVAVGVPGISPILRPAALPAAITHVRFAGAWGAGFGVDYYGSGVRLSIQAGPTSLPMFPEGPQSSVVVRDQPGTLQLESAANPSLNIWIWWREPGRYLPEPGAEEGSSVFYLVSGKGLDPDGILELVNGLGPG